MDRLLANDENTRRQAATELVEQATNNPEAVEPTIPTLLAYLGRSTDDMVSMQIASAISKTQEKIPTTAQAYSKEILASLDGLSSRGLTDDENESMITTAATLLLNSQVDYLLGNQSALEESLPLIMKFLEKKGSVKWSGYRIVSEISMTNPKILKDYAAQVIHLVGQGSTQLVIVLPHLYKLKPTDFEQNFHTLLEIYQTDANAKTTILQIFLEMSKSNPSLFEQHLPLLAGDLQSPVAASPVSQIMGEIARANPEAIYPYLNTLKQSMDTVDSLKYTIPNVLGLVGRLSEDVAREVLPILSSTLDGAEQNVAMMLLAEFRNLGEMNRELLVPYMNQIHKFAEDPQEYLRDQANLIIDYMEGRDIRSLAQKIEEQNARIKEAAVTYEALKEYMETNVEILKNFIADVTKKLPIPIKFSTEGRIRKTLQLHFVCGKQSERCLYPEDRAFIIESLTWNKWLKVAMSAVNIGKAVILPIEGSAVDTIREAYQAYKTEDDEEFLKYISEPFLTSQEQDNLILQLRSAQFFDVFHYDPQTADWTCLMCKRADS